MKGKEERDPSRMAGFFVSAINFIPLSWRISFCERLGRLAYALDGRHRRIALRNLALAFPEMMPEGREEIARRAFQNLGRVAAEFSFIPRLERTNLEKYISLEGLEHFFRAKEKGKGVLFLTAHFGNWEWMAAAFSLASHHPVHVVYRPLDSPFLDEVVGLLRKGTGNQTIPKQKAMGLMLRLLKKGEAIGILLDQNMAWQEGVFVNFFGELACTNTGMTALAVRTGVPVLPVFNVRQEDGRYKIILGAEISLVQTGDKDRDVIENTQLFTRVIEGYIRQYPDHWLWLHQRWKTRPWQAKILKSV